MSKKTLKIIGVVFVMTVSFYLPSQSQEAKMDQEKMMEAWMQPGAEPVESKNSSRSRIE